MLIERQYSLDAAGEDDSLRLATAIATRMGKPLRMRVQPQLLCDTLGTRYRAGMYLAWKGVYWNLSCSTAAEVVEIRDALASFFKLLEKVPGRLLQTEFDSRYLALADSPATVQITSAPDVAVGTNGSGR